MQRPLLGLMLSIFVGFVATAASFGQESSTAKTIDVDQALDRANGLIQQSIGEEAAMLLEDALPQAKGKQRAEVMHSLEKAYEIAARQAREAGNATDSQYYDDNLKILRQAPYLRDVGEPGDSTSPKASNAANNKVRGGKPSAATKPTTAPKKTSSPKPSAITNADEEPEAPRKAIKPSSAPAAEADPEEETPLEAPKAEGSTTKTAKAATSKNAKPVVDPEIIEEPEVATKPTQPKSASTTTAQPAAPKVDPVLSAADFAFETKNYLVAGRLYGKLANENRLPAERTKHLAYCRYSEITERLNTGPRGENEWTKIEKDAEAVRSLAPTEWYGSYLAKAIAEKRKTAESLADPGVRPATNSNTSPATNANANAAVTRSNLDPNAATAPRTQPQPAATDNPNPASAPAPAPRVPLVGQPGKSADGWQVWETDNFRVLHQNTVPLARQVASVAEKVRREQYRKWIGVDPARPWSKPCEIYLYPSAELFSSETGLSSDSPGFSLTNTSRGQVTSRRTNLRADDPKLLLTSLPHEMTHVVLADSFASIKTPPRWADEGMAVLSEPELERRQRAMDLMVPLQRGLVYSVGDLMTMEAPRDENWMVYYNQSVSLTWFLVEKSSPAQFLKFAQTASKKNSWEAELRSTYRIDGYQDLQRQWSNWLQAKFGGAAN